MREALVAMIDLLEQIAAMRSEAPGGASLTVVESTLVGGLMPPLHVHDEAEAFHVLEGSVTVFAGDEIVELEAGESHLAPPGVPHTHRVASGRARWLSMTFTRSTGLYEDFVRALGTPLAAGGVAPTPDDEAALLAFGAPNGIAVLGPPGMLPAEVRSPARRAA